METPRPRRKSLAGRVWGWITGDRPSPQKRSASAALCEPLALCDGSAEPAVAGALLDAAAEHGGVLVAVGQGPALPDSTLEQDRSEADRVRALYGDLGALSGQMLERTEAQLRPLTGGSSAVTFLRSCSCELAEVRSRLQQPMSCRIVVFGSTGAGKSTMLNALLYEASALPTSGWRACTSSPVEVEWSDSGPYCGAVELKSIEEWHAEVRCLLKDLQMRDGRVARSVPPATREAARSPKQAAHALLQAVYPECMEGRPWAGVAEAFRELSSAVNAATIMLQDAGWWPDRLEGLLGDLEDENGRVRCGLPERVSAQRRKAHRVLQRVYPQYFTNTTEKVFRKGELHAMLIDLLPRPPFKCSDACSLSAQLTEFVAAPDDPDRAAIWPLVNNVRITGPFHGAHPFVSLVDAPGVEDADATREKVVDKLLKNAFRIIIASNIKRAVSEKVAQGMFSERFRRQMLTDGHLQGVTFVATQTDEMTLSELRRNLGQQDLERLEAGRLRNTRTRGTLFQQCYKGWQSIRALAEEGRGTMAEFLSRGEGPSVFCTSSHDYQKLTQLLSQREDGPPKLWQSLEDTEIPQLRSWVHAQGQRYAVDECQLALERLRSVIGRMAAFCENAGGQADEWTPEQDERVRELAGSALHGTLRSLAEDADSAVHREVEALVLRTHTGAQTAAQEAADEFLPRCRPQRQGGLNWGTFKATVRRQGEWKEDFNEILSAPLSRRVAVRWDEVFNRLMPEALTRTAEAYRAQLCSFERELSEHLPGSKAHLIVEPARQLLQRRCEAARREAKARQQEGTRSIKDTMKTQMVPTYDRSFGVSAGPGIDDRQKSVLKGKVQDKTGCSKMLSVVRDGLLNDIETIVGWFREQAAEWSAAIVGSILGHVKEQARAAGERRDAVALRTTMFSLCAESRRAAEQVQDRLVELRSTLEALETQQRENSARGEGAVDPPASKRRRVALGAQGGSGSSGSGGRRASRHGDDSELREAPAAPGSGSSEPEPEEGPGETVGEDVDAESEAGADASGFDSDSASEGSMQASPA
eukprot:CAMPEP_0168394498 /NCGR_PEP_ID=MMETSP0228-20121227/19567_1 /TAXON_ID=133427 /ORGANISM="Protoceratium reticulatum, Strain CCCM 535 (=CCMP 1889)" /LENGTH=1040 /DNA_ID=CAMNT_0008407917 /DNA_START=37 /DNA_END=3159 /DNA_ORIENTATION=+